MFVSDLSKKREEREEERMVVLRILTNHFTLEVSVSLFACVNKFMLQSCCCIYFTGFIGWGRKFHCGGNSTSCVSDWCIHDRFLKSLCCNRICSRMDANLKLNCFLLFQKCQLLPNTEIPSIFLLLFCNFKSS